MSHCIGICTRYKSKPRFVDGNKKCTKCGIFIKWDGLYCPCCKQLLSAIPNSARYRRALRERKGVKEI